FLDFHLEWAAALESRDPEGAIRQYLLAEGCQITIGTGATGSGEGLASMAALYEIKGKRADLLERLGRGGAALELWEQIRKDPTGLGDDTPAADRLKRLRAKR